MSRQPVCDILMCKKGGTASFSKRNHEYALCLCKDHSSQIREHLASEVEPEDQEVDRLETLAKVMLEQGIKTYKCGQVKIEIDLEQDSNKKTKERQRFDEIKLYVLSRPKDFPLLGERIVQGDPSIASRISEEWKRAAGPYKETVSILLYAAGLVEEELKGVNK